MPVHQLATTRPGTVRAGTARPGARRVVPERRPARRLLAMFLPPVCVGCGRDGVVLCLPCSAAVAASHPMTVDPDIPVVAAAAFEGVVRRAVLALKFHNRRDAARVLARLVVERVDLGDVDLITWAPTHPDRVRRRGFDQAELVAREVARLLGVPCRRVLQRRRGLPQTGRSRAERLSADGGPGFRGRAPRRMRIAVIDDVATTGATLTAAVQALREAGIDGAIGVAVAATPGPLAAGAPRRRAVTPRPIGLPRRETCHR